MESQFKQEHEARKQTEAKNVELLAENKRLRSILEASPKPVCLGTSICGGCWETCPAYR